MFIMIQKCSLWKVLGVFFDEPLKIHYVKEIARKISLAPTSVKMHLDRLLKQNLIFKKRGERFFGFVANRESGDFLFYKKIGNVIKLKEAGLLGYVISSLYPEAIVAYGSYTRGEDIEKSDIDLFILTKVKKPLVLKKFEAFLGRTIHVITESNIQKLTPALRGEIINGEVLYGYLKI